VSLEKNKVIVRKMIETINSQNLTLWDKLMTPDFVVHMDAQKIEGLENNKQFIKDEINAFPDLHVTIEDIISEGDKVWVRLKETATHRGEYRGLAPTGNKLSYKVVAIWRIIHGKCIEGWIVYDQVDFLKQLGAISQTAFTDKDAL
jgi:C-1 hydroxylase